MIPFEKFKTPQDAYEWAKACGGGLMLARSHKGRGWWLLQLQPDMSWRSLAFASPSKLGILTVQECSR